MAKIIPAHVFIPDDGGDDTHPPILVVEEHAAELGNLIADHGVEVQNETNELAEARPASDLPEAEVKPLNGFRACMSESLSRPNGSERLTKAESQQRFREAVRACQIRRREEGEQQDT